jgi:cell fate regulator YaaT (PSP1 superfamily)
MEIVKVRLRKPTRVFTFLCEDVPLQRDEDCIVRTERGLEYGTCIVPPEPIPEAAKSRYKMSVVRKITHQDETTYHHIQMEEERAIETCRMRIRERSLPMKLVDAEYTFDRHKIIFYFTADDRVDFRQLVRDLAQDLKTRIELRHIQVRDEAKIVGGIGVCGRELCCSTWLREFKPISMKMAKRQNLSLNPSKISGQCGRLLCCLSYENEQYQEQRGRREMSAVAGRDETEVDYQEALGHEGAFARSDIRHKPEDWAGRLEDMGADVDLASDGDPAAVVDFGNGDTGATTPLRPQDDHARPQGQQQQPAKAYEPHTHEGRRRRRRGQGGGRGPHGGQPGGGSPGAGS